MNNFDFKAPTIPIQNTPSGNVILETNLDSIKITINTKNRWGWFVAELFQWIIVGLCGVPVLGITSLAILQEYLPKNTGFFIWGLMGCLFLYLLYKKSRETLELISNKEVIEIDHISVKVEKISRGIRLRKEYPADKIKRIILSPSDGKIPGLLRPFISNAYNEAFIIWDSRNRTKFHSFGRGIQATDARIILEKVYTKFPQYKGEILQ